MKNRGEALGSPGVLPLRELVDSNYDDLKSFRVQGDIEIDCPLGITEMMPYVAHLKNLTALPASTAFLDSRLRLRSDEIFETSRSFPTFPRRHSPHVEKVLQKRLARIQMQLRRKKISSGTHLFAEYEGNYFHWIIEALTRVIALKRHVSLQDLPPFFVSSNLPPQHYQALELLLERRCSVTRVPPTHAVEAREWIYAAPTNRLNENFTLPYLDSFMYIDPEVTGELREFVLGCYPPIKMENQDFFVLRNSTYRRPVNQASVVENLTRQGFSPLNPARLSFREQVMSFGAAQKIVAPSGASLANILWMRPGSEVFVLAPRHPMKAYPFWKQLADIAGVNLQIIWQTPKAKITAFDESSWHTDYWVDTNELLGLLTG